MKRRDIYTHKLGSRLRAARLQRNLSQADLAQAAGIGRVTLQRIEGGSTGASLPSLIRVLRALDLSDGLDRLLPEPTPSPVDEVRRRGSQRKRASSPRSSARGDGSPSPWRWGDEGSD